MTTAGKKKAAAPTTSVEAAAAVSQGAHATTSDEAGAIAPTHLVVRALTPGFRRAGRAWGVEEVTVPIGEFSDAQVEALLAEPELVVLPLVAAEEA